MIRKKIVDEKIVSVAMGGFNDDKNGKKKVINLFMIKNDLYGVGENGLLRIWKI